MSTCAKYLRFEMDESWTALALKVLVQEMFTLSHIQPFNLKIETKVRGKARAFFPQSGGNTRSIYDVSPHPLFLQAPKGESFA